MEEDLSLSLVLSLSLRQCVVSRRGSGLVKTLLRTRTFQGQLFPERSRAAPPRRVETDRLLWREGVCCCDMEHV